LHEFEIATGLTEPKPDLRDTCRALACWDLQERVGASTASAARWLLWRALRDPVGLVEIAASSRSRTSRKPGKNIRTFARTTIESSSLRCREKPSKQQGPQSIIFRTKGQSSQSRLTLSLNSQVSTTAEAERPVSRPKYRSTARPFRASARRRTCGWRFRRLPLEVSSFVVHSGHRKPPHRPRQPRGTTEYVARNKIGSAREVGVSLARPGK